MDTSASQTETYPMVWGIDERPWRSREGFTQYMQVSTHLQSRSSQKSAQDLNRFMLQRNIVALEQSCGDRHQLALFLGAVAKAVWRHEIAQDLQARLSFTTLVHRITAHFASPGHQTGGDECLLRPA